MNKIEHLPRIYSEVEAAQYLNVSKRTLARLRRRGEIKFKTVGRAVRYPEAALIEYMEPSKCPGSDSLTNTSSLPAAAQLTGISNGVKKAFPGAVVRALKAFS